MIVALILLTALVVVGGLLYVHHRLSSGNEAEGATEQAVEEAAGEQSGEVCCGMHITCEKDSLVAGIDRELLYYDDEELDRFKGRAENEYTEAETEEFREVLLTLQPDDIAGWARSLTDRGITMPGIVKQELLMIVAEIRHSRNVPAQGEEAIA